MVGSVTDYQKPLATRKIKRNNAGGTAVREIRKLKKNSGHFVNKLPYRHLLREFSTDMKTLIDEEAITRKSVKTLHQASQAYLSGLFDGYTNVCPRVAKRESTALLLYLASLGLNRVVRTVAQDKHMALAARQSSHHFHHHHSHTEWTDLADLDSNDHHQQHPPLSEDTEEESEDEGGNNNSGDTSDIISRIMDRISRNVTVTVLRDD